MLPRTGWRDSARRILPLAWPVFIAQLAVVAFGTVDTLLVARYAALDLAALAVGSAAYITVFIGFMGVVVAAGPIVGQFFGAGQLHEAGHQLHQAVWVALALSVVGSTLLAFPRPFWRMAQATPEVEAKMRQYLLALAFALPAALLFAAYRSFNNAVSRPKAVMVIQLAGLGLKVPLSAALVFGVPALGVPSLGVLGCGIATVIAMWSQVAAGLWVLMRDRFYAPFALGTRLRAPDRQGHRRATAAGPADGRVDPDRGHRLCLHGDLHRAPGRHAGGRAPAGGEPGVGAVHAAAGAGQRHRRRWWRSASARATSGPRGASAGMGCRSACAWPRWWAWPSTLARHGVVRLYTSDAAVIAAALPLLAWVALFHAADAAQCVASFVLRAYRIATLPMIIFAVSLWGVGLGGGYVLAFNVTGLTPDALLGARGFWVASTAGLVLAAASLSGLLLWVLRRQWRREAA